MVIRSEERDLDIYFQILGGHQEQIRFADSKAAFVAAMNALLFGFMATNFESLKTIYETYGPNSAAFGGPLLALILYMGSSMSSLWLAVLGVMPRFGELAPQSRIFFGHIARNCGKDYEKYVREISAMTNEDWARDIGTQIVEVSHIALTKHQRVRWAAIWVLIPAGLWVVSFVVLLVMTPVSQKKGGLSQATTFHENKAIGSDRDGPQACYTAHIRTLALLDQKEEKPCRSVRRSSGAGFEPHGRPVG